MANYQRLIGAAVGTVSLGIGALATFRSGIFYVEPGHRAFKFNKISGVQEKIYREGYNFKIPLLERQVDFNV